MYYILNHFLYRRARLRHWDWWGWDNQIILKGHGVERVIDGCKMVGVERGWKCRGQIRIVERGIDQIGVHIAEIEKIVGNHFIYAIMIINLISTSHLNPIKIYFQTLVGFESQSIPF